MMPEQVELYIDGACSGNPGPGGWGVVMRFGEHEKELSGGDHDTTNNRMELMAAIRSLESLSRSCDVLLVTDSQYVMKGVTQWLPVWKRRNWMTTDRKPVKNIDLWRRLDQATERHRIKWEWTRGHSGHLGNERADSLARAAIPARRDGHRRNE